MDQVCKPFSAHRLALALAIVPGAGCSSSAHAADAGPTPATPFEQARWITTDDYPTGALREAVTGAVGYRLVVDAAGSAIGCEIVQSSGSDVLDSNTCTLLKVRARFIPATDDKGQPTVGSFTGRVRWQIPKPPAPEEFQWNKPLAPYRVVVSWIVGVDGTASDCRITQAEGDVPLGARLVGPSDCPLGDKFTPILDAAGKPVARRVRLTMAMEVTPP